MSGIIRNLREFYSKFPKTIVTLSILTGAAAAIGLVSGIGSTCTTFDPIWWKIDSFSIIEDFQLVFVITYMVTWLVAIAWGVLFWALLRRKTWFYNTALITSIAGFLSGFIPAAILLYDWYMSYGETGMMFTPSWFRTIINLAILIMLLIPVIRHGITDHMEEIGASTGGSVGSDVAQFAYVLFGFGIVMMVQPLIMPMHIIDGVNIASSYGYLLASGTLQLFGGLFFILLGIITRIAGQLLNIVSSSKPTPLKV